MSAPARPPLTMTAVQQRLSPDVIGSRTKIVKVKQPWADALVTGRKDVENRTWPIVPGCGENTPMWFLVASSKSKPTAAMMADYRRRLALTDPDGRLFEDNTGEFSYGDILGLVLLKGCYKSWNSPWYNSPDLAWVVQAAWEFRTPIPLDPNDGFQTQASLGEGDRARFQYVERVRAEIARLV